MLKVEKVRGGDDPLFSIGDGTLGIQLSEPQIKDLIGDLQAALCNHHWSLYAERHTEPAA